MQGGISHRCMISVIDRQSLHIVLIEKAHAMHRTRLKEKKIIEKNLKVQNEDH